MAEASRRVFVALWPEPAVADALSELAAYAQKVCGGRRMRGDSLHVTLDFLGDVAEFRLPVLLGALAAVQGMGFRLDIDRLGYWQHNRILWAGCRVWPQELDDLVRDIRGALAGAGLTAQDPGGPDFFPHVTLLRKAHSADVLPGLEAIAWPVREWVLMESCLSSAGAAYRRLGAWPLT